MKIAKFFLICFVFLFLFLEQSRAQEFLLDYGEDLILDSDLDGLTDLGEEQLFKTDKVDPDTDSDGMLDGAEVIGGSDPLDQLSPMATKVVKEKYFQEKREVPWAWYVVRATGVVAFLCLFFSVFLGLIGRIPFFQARISPATSIEIHGWVSLHALLFSIVHAVGLLFDSYLGFGLRDILIPFASEFEPIFLALGIISFYLMLILVVSSYLRRKITYKIWRSIHYLNILLYVFVVVHVFAMGTDLQNAAVKGGFYLLNVALFFVLFFHVLARVKSRSKRV